MPHKFREEWLNEGLILLRKEIFLPAKHKLDPKIKVSCGFPSVGAFAAKRRRVAECWYPLKKGDPHQLFVSPTRADAVTVLDDLTHECVHTITGAKVGHRAGFKKVMWEVGLEGPARATHAGPELKKALTQFAKSLGPYPHVALDKLTTGRKKQTTRLLKASCECGYCVRITSKWVEEAGLPDCPACSVTLELES